MSHPVPIFFTSQGLAELQNEYDHLSSQRPVFVSELATARDMGDRSENAAYKSARRKLSQTDSRLRYLKNLLSRAQVVAPTQTDLVEIGVSVILETPEETYTYKIVGSHESNPASGQVSYLSPLGQALMGRFVGERIAVLTPSGQREYKIIKIL